MPTMPAMPAITKPAHRNPGFTLIELLVTLCITGILALSAYPLYRTAVLKAKRAQANAALLRAIQQQERYYSQHNRYVAYQGPSAAGAVDDNAFIWFSADDAATSAYQISAAACSGQSLEQCVSVTASPGGALVNTSYDDELCGTLSLNSRGEKTAASLPLDQAPDVCR